MFKETALVTWDPASDEAGRRAALERADAAISSRLSVQGTGHPASFRGGDVVWHLHFDSQDAWRNSGAGAALDDLASDPCVQNLDTAAYSVDRFAVPHPEITSGIYRALFINLLPGATPQASLAFENDLAGMQTYIPEIVNWAVNPVVHSRGDHAWSYVWEQEFAHIEDLVGPYMKSAFHWALVDRWFDVEMPGRIARDGALRHSASELSESVIADYSQ